MSWLLIIAVLLLLGGYFSTVRSRKLQQLTGLPVGRLVYADTHGQDWRPAPKPLYSPRYRLAGKPDYLVETARGLIPVEVKSGAAPEAPYLGHLLQLAAYCLLIEETTGQAPPHGLLKYADALFEVDFTRELRAELLETMSDMRRARLARNTPRNHNQPGKCAHCRFRQVCDEALI
jgi:CRISPR-associated exonuclease Cas4